MKSVPETILRAKVGRREETRGEEKREKEEKLTSENVKNIQ